MNGAHHEDLTRTALELLRKEGPISPLIVGDSSLPDRLDDVFCQQLLGAPLKSIAGHNLTSFVHFQGGPAGRQGYCWQDDESLSLLHQLGEAAMAVDDVEVLGTSAPMLAACAAQPHARLSEFRFPWAGTMARYYREKLAHRPGLVCHFVQDACVPHHVWRVLGYGHTDWENEIEQQWAAHRKMLRLASDPGLLAEVLGAAVEREKIGACLIADIAAENSYWATHWFGKAHPLAACPEDAALAVCVRAVASTLHALKLMGIT